MARANGSPVAAFAFWLFAAVLSILFASGEARAASVERYEYDGLGRLVRVINGAGQAVEYVYDAAGNINAVVAGGQAQPPVASALTPSAVRRGSVSRFTLTGAQLSNATLSASDEGIQISKVSRSATSISFDLVVGDAVPMGANRITVSTAAGEASLTLTVRPALPTAAVSPLPIAVAPGASSITYDLTLSGADDEPHSFALSMLRPEVASVSPAAVSFGAGQTTAKFAVRGLVGGNTELRLTSSTLGLLQVPVFVTATPEGISIARAQSVGVELAGSPAPPIGVMGSLLSPLVGLYWGGTQWLDTSPRHVPQGSSQVLVITGAGLASDMQVSILPADGLTWTRPVVSPDGSRAELTVTATGNAVRGLRRLVLSSSGAQLTPVALGVDQVAVVGPGPSIDSVAPIVFQPGSGGMPLVVRGRNLSDVSSIEVRGGDVVTSSSWTVNADGTELLTRLDVALVAEPGPRVVVVNSPSGSSSNIASAANTLLVASELASLDEWKDFSASPVGVVLEPNTETASMTQRADSPAIGVTFGPMVSGFEPPSIARGETKQVVIRGANLEQTSLVSLTPGQGLTVQEQQVEVDGSAIRVTLSAAQDAALGTRALRVVAGAETVPFAPGIWPTLLVTPVVPVLDSIEPNTALATETFRLLLRGRNFLNATAVRIQPATGLSIGPVSVNADGTEAEVTVSVSAAAAVGPRVVSLVAPAGETLTVAAATNVLTIGKAPIRYPDLLALAVGVQFGEPVSTGGETAREIAQFSSAVGVQLGDVSEIGTPQSAWALAVGVQFGSLTASQSLEQTHLSERTGVVLGAAVTNIAPQGVVRGRTYEVTAAGWGMPVGSRLDVTPAACLAIQGAAALLDDGARLTQSISVPSDGGPATCRLRVLDAQGNELPTASAEMGLLEVVTALPEIVSIEPILARQGDRGSLLIRGSGLSAVKQVLVEPSAGLELGSTFSANAAGTELTVSFAVRTDASLGARVVRVFNAAGASASAASPANTFTVYPKE